MKHPGLAINALAEELLQVVNEPGITEDQIVLHGALVFASVGSVLQQTLTGDQLHRALKFADTALAMNPFEVGAMATFLDMVELPEVMPSDATLQFQFLRQPIPLYVAVRNIWSFKVSKFDAYAATEESLKAQNPAIPDVFAGMMKVQRTKITGVYQGVKFEMSNLSCPPACYRVVYAELLKNKLCS